MGSRLFRDEAVANRRISFLGTVRLHRPLGFAWASGGTVALGLTLVALVFWGSLHRKATVTGLLVPVRGVSALTAPLAGVVVRQVADEGRRVEAGQVLFEIQASRASNHGETTARVDAQLSARRATLDDQVRIRRSQHAQQVVATRERLQGMDAELQRHDEALNLQQDRLVLMRRVWQRQRRLAAEGFVSITQAQQREAEWLDVQANLRSMERTRAALHRELRTTRADLLRLDTQLQTDLAELERQRALLEQERAENDARESALVRAPQAGVITALHLQAGQTVQAGQNLGMLTAPDAPLEAHLFAASQKAGFVEPGQPVFLRYAAYPYQKFGMHDGVVAQVSRTPFAASELPPGITPEGAQSLYRITVKLKNQSLNAYGTQHPLKPGMTLDADILQERRAVWEWIFEPLLAAKAKVHPAHSHNEP